MQCGRHQQGLNHERYWTGGAGVIFSFSISWPCRLEGPGPGQITGNAKLEVFSEVIPPFNLMPRSMLEVRLAFTSPRHVMHHVSIVLPIALDPPHAPVSFANASVGLQMCSPGR
eukprot:918551-Pelagomonas_calceolata.AAC.1